jgi:hypothetical protein
MTKSALISTVLVPILFALSASGFAQETELRVPTKSQMQSRALVYATTKDPVIKAQVMQEQTNLGETGWASYSRKDWDRYQIKLCRMKLMEKSAMDGNIPDGDMLTVLDALEDLEDLIEANHEKVTDAHERINEIIDFLNKQFSGKS